MTTPKTKKKFSATFVGRLLKGILAGAADSLGITAVIENIKAPTPEPGKLDYIRLAAFVCFFAVVVALAGKVINLETAQSLLEILQSLIPSAT